MPSFINYVPTSPEQIDGFFELAPVSLSDVVYDLGSGDGRLLFAALDKGAGMAVGVELNPNLIRKAEEIARSKGLDDRISFLREDVMEVNLSDATLVLCYLINSASTALKLKFESELKPGTRVVMEAFHIPGWKPVRTIKKGPKQFFLYTMPSEFSDEYPADNDEDYDIW